MPFILQCPNGHPLRVQDQDAGKRIRCPRCKAILEATPPDPAPETAPAPPSPAEAQITVAPRLPAHEPSPIRSRRSSEAEGVSAVPTGRGKAPGTLPRDVLLIDDDKHGVEAIVGEDQIGLECEYGHRLLVHERYEGKEVICPGCRTSVEVPRFGIPLPREEEASDEERERSRRPGGRKRRRRRRGEGKSTEGLDKVNWGLGFHYARLVLLLLCMIGYGLVNILAIFTGVAATAGSMEGVGVGGGLLILLSFLLTVSVSFIAPVLGIVGSALCLFVPPQSGARGMILASLILDLLIIPVSLIFFLGGMVAGGNPFLALAAILVPMVMGLVSWMLFILFLKGLSLYLEEETMADEAIAILMRGIGLLFLGPILLFIGVFLAGLIPCFGVICFFTILGGVLWYAFNLLRRQLDLIGSLRQVIHSKY